MNINTGEIHTLKPGQSIQGLANELGASPKDFVPLDKLPGIKCRKCNGSGRVKRGLQSKRWKPCKCTKEKHEQA